MLTDDERVEVILSEWLADFSERTEAGLVARAVLPKLKLLATPMPDGFDEPEVITSLIMAPVVSWHQFNLALTPAEASALGAALIRAALAAKKDGE